MEGSMKKVLVFLAEGFEEIEALTPIDVLRRAGAEVTVAGVGGLTIRGSHSVSVVCDVAVEDVKGDFDCVICPGGMPGSVNLSASWAVNELTIRTAANGGVVAAICAAPAVVLGPAGLLDGHQAVCFPGMEKAYPEFTFANDRVLVSGNLITARAAGCAMDFALTIVRVLFGQKKNDSLSESLIVR